MSESKPSQLQSLHDITPVFRDAGTSVDRNPRIPQSSGLQLVYGKQALKMALLITGVVLAPILAVRLLLAAGDWRVIGQTEAGDRVSISAVRVLKNNQRSALVRVEYKQPTKLPQGGPFIEMRARVRFNCTTGAASPSSVWFYTRDHSGRDVVSKKATHDDEFGNAAEGGFVQLVSKNVCSQTK